MTNPLEHAVARHYARPGLFEDIEQGLARREGTAGQLEPTDTAAVDEFHTAGRAATLKALQIFPVEAGMRVLDAGAGIGGTARVLARERGCTVTGIDLTADYVDTARALTEKMGLTGQCRFEQGSVLEMPFDAAAFDAALSFHVAMNIDDRATFYAELARVLRPGAPLCIYDVMKGPGSGMRYPVPWAESEATSFLRTRDDTVALLTAAGFEWVAEENLRDFAIDFFKAAFAQSAAAEGPPPLGLHLLTGANAAEKFANYAAALEAHQIEPVILSLRKC